MAESTSSGAFGQLPAKVEASTTPNLSQARVTRRQWTLIAITGLLNVLFVCSIMCIIVQIYQIVSDPNDPSNIASEILTITSVRTSSLRTQSEAQELHCSSFSDIMYLPLICKL